MIKVPCIFLSEGVVVDQRNGLASAYNIIEVVNSNVFPSVANKIYMLAYLERDEKDPSDIEVEFKLLNNDIVLHASQIQNLSFGKKLKHKRVLTFNDVTIKEPGNLFLILYYKNKEIGKYAIEVQKVDS